VVRILQRHRDQGQPGTWGRERSLLMPVAPIERLATEELMGAAKSKSAWVALLAAGGLYAWQNRDKIQGWLNSQRDQLNSQSSSLPATGATQRIDSQDVPTTSHRRGIYSAE
jgi:hypothetical protein